MSTDTIHRLLKPPIRSFFLFGARGTGKSTWLRSRFKDALFIDLLDSAIMLELSRSPHTLEAMIAGSDPDAWIVLDEAQKIPTILDEVHRT